MDYHSLDDLINSLDGDVRHTLSESKKNWKDIWGQIREIGSSFKETRYPTREEKNSAWDRFQSIVDDVKNAQENDQRDWKGKEQSSRSCKEEILNYIGRSSSTNALGEVAYALFGANLIESAINSLPPGGGEIKSDSAKDELLLASSTLQKGWKLFSSYKDKMLGKDKQEVFQALTSAQNQLNREWDNYKKAKQSAHEARQESWKKKQQDWEKKQQEWRERTEDNIGENETRLDKLQRVRDHKESHISDLQNKIDSDSSRNYRERVEGWIDEEEDAIRSIDEKIRRVEGWINDSRNKLR